MKRSHSLTFLASEGEVLGAPPARKGESVKGAVVYTCQAESHQSGGGGPDKLTVHKGEWAFCPYDARSDGHQWVATAGIAIDALRRTAAAHERERERIKSAAR